MTKREWEARLWQEERLAKLGISAEDAAKLRRISSSLRRSFEFSCSVAETEANAAKREQREDRLALRAQEIVGKAWDGDPDKAPMVYIQTDPRGCALYVVPAEVRERFFGHSLDAIYDQGIAVFS